MFAVQVLLFPSEGCDKLGQYQPATPPGGGRSGVYGFPYYLSISWKSSEMCPSLHKACSDLLLSARGTPGDRLQVVWYAAGIVLLLFMDYIF